MFVFIASLLITAALPKADTVLVDSLNRPWHAGKAYWAIYQKDATKADELLYQLRTTDGWLIEEGHYHLRYRGIAPDSFRNGKWRFLEQGHLRMVGQYKDDRMVSEWRLLYPSGKLKRWINWDKGEKADECLDETGITIPCYPILTLAEPDYNLNATAKKQMPQRPVRLAPGTMVAFDIYVTILEDGRLTNVHTEVPLSSPYQEVAVQLVEQLPPWKPAVFDYRTFRTQVRIPVEFIRRDKENPYARFKSLAFLGPGAIAIRIYE